MHQFLIAFVILPISMYKRKLPYNYVVVLGLLLINGFFLLRFSICIVLEYVHTVCYSCNLKLLHNIVFVQLHSKETTTYTFLCSLFV